jgi:hypothetical protein
MLLASCTPNLTPAAKRMPARAQSTFDMQRRIEHESLTIIVQGTFRAECQECMLAGGARTTPECMKPSTAR